MVLAMEPGIIPEVIREAVLPQACNLEGKHGNQAH